MHTQPIVNTVHVQNSKNKGNNEVTCKNKQTYKDKKPTPHIHTL